MDLTDRIIAYCERKKIKQIDLIDIGCGSKGTINNVFRKKNEPSAKFVEAFLNGYPDIDARWLLTGKEDQVVEESKTQYGFCKECIKKEGIIEYLKKELALRDKKIEELERDAESQAQKEVKAS